MYFQDDLLTWLAIWCRIGLKIQLGLKDRGLDSSRMAFSVSPRLAHNRLPGFQDQAS